MHRVLLNCCGPQQPRDPMFTCIDEIPKEEWRGKRVLVRAGFDLPVNEQGEVSDLFRVKRGVPTLTYLAEAGAKVIILSHIGRDPKETNEAVSRALAHHIKLTYIPDLFGHMAQSALTAMRDGEVVLLENLRQHYDLEKAKDATFARNLASLGDIYVNDAFSNSHREHASMVVLPTLLPHYAGFLVRDEVARLKEALLPPYPSLAIIGGAKFETKDPVIRSFLGKYDHVFVTGAIANDVLRVQGFPVGRSRISEHAPEPSVVHHPHLLTSVDVTVQELDGHAKVKKPEEVEAEDKIVDMGPNTLTILAPHIEKANFILWNGPTGLYEEGFMHYTHAIAEMVARRVAAGAHAVIGGGDTIAAIQESGISSESLGFVSTGGGAMLEYLLKGTLPAIEALK